MTTSTQEISPHVQENYKFFKQKLDAGELDDYMGDYVLIIDQKIVSVHTTMREAHFKGLEMRESNPNLKFSVQEVTHQIVELGFQGAFA